MSILDIAWFRLLEITQRVREEERGDSMVNWLVLAVGLATVAAAIVLLLGPALKTAANHIVSVLTGS
jgi:hypothetical protein